MGRPFTARFGGPCAADCGDRIEAGDPVAYSDDELMHEACAERDIESTARIAADESTIACGSCWTVHRGECL